MISYQLARIAYEQDPMAMVGQVAATLCVPKSSVRTVFVERTDTEGFIARRNHTLYLSFSGTESLRDILTDLVFIPSRYEYGGRVHKGFGEAIASIKAPFLSAVSELFPDGPPASYLACGHSLGAPLAIGACDHLHHALGETKGSLVQTFGCPNGWSRSAAAGVGSRHMVWNFINPGDYVTWMLGLSTRRPGNDIKLHGNWGHGMRKYGGNLCVKY